MTRTELDQGAWVELRDPKNVPERLRRPFVNALTAMLSDESTVAAIKGSDLEAMQAHPEEAIGLIAGTNILDATSAMNDVLVLALVSAWSFSDTVSIDVLLDLPGWAYDAVRDLCAPFTGDLMPDFGPSPDPKALTAS